jgi:hypothetical protein
MWDWKEQPPIGDIIESAAKIKGVKAWTVDNGSDSYELILAPTLKGAQKCKKDTDEDYIKEMVELEGKDFKYEIPNIYPWDDEERILTFL